jgi:hypothetical protein
MTNALALGEKLLSLLDESAQTTTYRPALLLALVDRVQEYAGSDTIPVTALAERVIELYWPQTGSTCRPAACCARPKPTGSPPSSPASATR